MVETTHNMEVHETMREEIDLTENRWRAYLRLSEQWIPIDMIQVDRDSYQRDAAHKVVESIKQGLDFGIFGRIWVTLRDDNSYYVIEGGSRFNGLKAIGYTGSVPCFVIPHTSIQQEAKQFVEMDEKRTKLSAFHVYNASLCAKKQWALDIHNALSAKELQMHGGPISKDWRKVSCTFALKYIWEVEGPGGRQEGVNKVVDLAFSIFPKDNRAFGVYLLRGLHAAVRANALKGNPDLERLKTAMKNIGSYDAFMVKLLKERSSRSISDHEASVAALKSIYNKTVKAPDKWE